MCLLLCDFPAAESIMLVRSIPMVEVDVGARDENLTVILSIKYRLRALLLMNICGGLRVIRVV